MYPILIINILNTNLIKRRLRLLKSACVFLFIHCCFYLFYIFNKMNYRNIIIINVVIIISTFI